MPIYDHNGTSNYEVKTVFDNDRTVQYQIGKVYDYDGTTMHEVYTGEEFLFDNGDNPSLSGGWYQYDGDGTFTMSNVLSLTTPLCQVACNNFMDNAKYVGIEVTGRHWTNVASGSNNIYVELARADMVSMGRQIFRAEVANTWTPFTIQLLANKDGNFKVQLRINGTTGATGKLEVSQIRLIER